MNNSAFVQHGDIMDDVLESLSKLPQLSYYNKIMEIDDDNNTILSFYKDHYFYCFSVKKIIVGYDSYIFEINFNFISPRKEKDYIIKNFLIKEKFKSSKARNKNIYRKFILTMENVSEEFIGMVIRMGDLCKKIDLN